MAQTTFTGPVRSLNGFISQGAGTTVNLANNTNTITLDPATHGGKFITVDDATIVITLPTINATAADSPDTLNNLGVTYTIYIATASTNSAIVTDGTDKFVGSCHMVDTDTGGTVTAFAPAASNDVINLNGTTTGGIVGSWVRITATQALEYFVEGTLLASGAVVTPFADTDA